MEKAQSTSEAAPVDPGLWGPWAVGAVGWGHGLHCRVPPARAVLTCAPCILLVCGHRALVCWEKLDKNQGTSRWTHISSYLQLGVALMEQNKLCLFGEGVHTHMGEVHSLLALPGVAETFTGPGSAG